jgi:hypothetical protein
VRIFNPMTPIGAMVLDPLTMVFRRRHRYLEPDIRERYRLWHATPSGPKDVSTLILRPGQRRRAVGRVWPSFMVSSAAVGGYIKVRSKEGQGTTPHVYRFRRAYAEEYAFTMGAGHPHETHQHAETRNKFSQGHWWRLDIVQVVASPQFMDPRSDFPSPAPHIV